MWVPAVSVQGSQFWAQDLYVRAAQVAQREPDASKITLEQRMRQKTLLSTKVFAWGFNLCLFEAELDTALKEIRAVRNATETLRSGARVAYVGSGETHGTSEPKKIVVVEGTPTDEELIARYGGTFGGRVDRTTKSFGGVYDLIVWASSE